MPEGREKITAPVILITDDNLEDRLRMRRYLESDGYNLLEASGSKEALSIAEDPRNRIDLLITDVRMPFLNGCDLEKRIRVLRPELKVLFVSGYSMEILALFKLGFEKSTLINKSVDKDTFQSLVRRFLSSPVPIPHPTES